MRKKAVVISLIVIVILTILLIIVNITDKKDNKKENENLNNVAKQNIEKLADGTEKNNNDNFLKVKKFNNYEISNVLFTSKDNLTKITCNIKNISNKKIDEKEINFILKDKEGKDISKLSCYVSTLESNEMTVLKTSSTLNYINAYDYIIEEVK